jgi:cytochrome c oxidase subunit 2
MIGRSSALAALFLALSAGGAAAQDAGRPWPWQWNFQDAASPTMERIAALTLTLNAIIVLVVVFITAVVGYIVWRFRASRNPVPARWTHNTKLEIAWTTIPVLILVAIAFPSFHLLYFMDRVQQADLTLKVTGHQWYWSYEYPDQKVKFDSMLVDEASLKPGQLRLLTVDHPVVLPVGVPIRVQMTADDVIHSWAVPAFGIKTDSVPGRLNETWVQITRPGTYYGQCSELCGVNHGYMPIMVQAVPREEFQGWLKQAQLDFPAEKTSDLAQGAQ